MYRYFGSHCKTNLIVLGCILAWQQVDAQCGAIDFLLPGTGCISQTINVAPASTYLDYEWDFCAGDFDQLPSASVFYAAAGSAYKVELVEQGGQYFGFYTSRNNGKLYRLDFGTDVTSTPTPIDLGGLGIGSSAWLTIEIVKEGNQYYGFIIDFGNKVYRFSFGSSITNAPAVAEVFYENALLTNPIDLTVVEDESGKYAFIANFNSNRITRIAFSSSFAEVIGATAIDEVTVTGSGNLSGISFIRECDLWYAVTTSIGGGNISKILFDAGLIDDSPGISAVGGLPFMADSPGGVALAFENNKYYAFIQSQQAQSRLYKIEFGNSMENAPTANSADLGNLGLLTNVFGFSMYKVKSDWLVLGSENTGQNIYRVTFPNNCFSNLTYSTVPENLITITSGAGTHHVSLISHTAMGYVMGASKTITLSSNIPPDISFSSQNVCVGHDIQFTSLNVSGNIIGYNWDFGDNTSSTQPNPIHQYSSRNEFTIELEVTASNGCKNFTRQYLSTYIEPVADFAMPLVLPVCTNQNFNFDNVSTVDPGYSPSWEWIVNGSIVTTNEDLSYTFLNASNHEIRLKASIPGCDNEMIKNINSLVEGPVPDFSFIGQCEDVDVAFTNNSSGTISGYLWDFDDGHNAAIVNPVNLFSDIGVYDVTLTVSNLAGCNNTVTKAVAIYSKPQVNFEALAPPFSCNGTPTEFRDLTPNPTDSNLSSWQWNFGDAGSGQNTSALRNPQHVYNIAGVYDVTLTVSTNFLCSASLQLPVTISQSPTAAFIHSPPCEDVEVDFSDASTGSVVSWEWQIGSTIYTSQNPTHTFLNVGTATAALSVTASNGCIGSTNETIVVPAKLAPNFSVSKNCVNQETLFTSTTNDIADPINVYEWEVIGGATATGSPAVFSFSEIGTPSVKLKVATQTGCEYAITKSVSIIPSPVANFTATPEIGGSPLFVQFTNTSVNATTYHWTFNDALNSTSAETSPFFIFEDFGQYQVELTAFNAQNCLHTFSNVIEVLTPVMDVDPNLNQEQPLILSPPYPNPSTSGVLNVNWILKENGIVSMKLVNTVGQVVKDFQFDSVEGLNQFSLKTSGIGGGVYFVKFNYKQNTKVYTVMISE